MATPIDPNEQASINAGTLAALKVLSAKARDFVSKVYLPDLLAVASFYKDWAAHGAGPGNYMVYGEYPEGPEPDSPRFLPGGVIRNRDLSQVEEGEYDLICLPLRIVGADGSPARVVLRSRS